MCFLLCLPINQFIVRLISVYIEKHSEDFFYYYLGRLGSICNIMHVQSFLFF